MENRESLCWARYGLVTLPRDLLVALVLVGLTAVASAAEPSEFVGKWSGEGENSLGEKGKTTLDLQADEKGRLSGTWSYEVSPGRSKSARVTQNKSSKNSIDLLGRMRDARYQITVTIKDGEMRLSYSGKRVDATQGFKGEARLKRD